MKAAICSLIIIICSILFLGTFSNLHALDKFHSYENYKTTYKLEGVKTGEKIFCSRNWGNEKVQIERVAINISPNETKKNNQKVITKIIDGEQWIYSINLDDNTGTKAKNPSFPALKESIKGKDPAEFGKFFLKQLGGEIIGKKEILGIKCDIWKISVLQTCVSDKGIALETRSDNPKLVETATSIDTANTCSQDQFDVGDAKIKEIDINSLKQQ
ncbi:MAG: hypothetical protein ACRENO_04265 [Thermodesulfobacteriota bacterium]